MDSMLLNISMGIRRYVARLMYLYPRVGNFRMPNYDNAVSGVFGSDFKPNFFLIKKESSVGCMNILIWYSNFILISILYNIIQIKMQHFQNLTYRRFCWRAWQQPGIISWLPALIALQITTYQSLHQSWFLISASNSKISNCQFTPVAFCNNYISIYEILIYFRFPSHCFLDDSLEILFDFRSLFSTI